MNHLTIGKRLGLSFALVLLLSMATIAVGLTRLHASAVATREMMREPLSKERLLADWNRNIHAGVRRTGAIAKSSDPSLLAFFTEDQALSTRQVDEMLKSIELLLRQPEERALLDQVNAVRKVYGDARADILRLKKEGRLEEAEKALSEGFVPASKVYLERMQALVDHQRADMDDTAAAINARNEAGTWLLLALGLATLALGSACAWLITRSITHPLRAALDQARRVSEGDLSAASAASGARAAGKDEIGQLLQALEHMRGTLGEKVHTIQRSVDSITTASSEIASANHDLSSRTEHAASNLQETASAMEQITATVRQSAEAAQQANQLAVTATDVAQRGGRVVADVVSTMGAINESSRRIADIIGVIDGIAFQTNILALNAAVEAARAGEQGRGFAVVASEVRSLAQRSATAAREIKTLIGQSEERVEAGARRVADAGSTMDELVASVQRFTAIMGEISTASGEQSDGLSQVNTAVGVLDQMTQQNAALVEQSSATASSLREQAQQLGAVVATFRL